MNKYIAEDIKPGFVFMPKQKKIFQHFKWIAIIVKVGFRPNPDLDIFFSDSQTLIKEHRTIYDFLSVLNRDIFYVVKTNEE